MSEVIAARIDADIRALQRRSTSAVRAVRRSWSAALTGESADVVLETARALARLPSRRWVACELVRRHPAAFARSAEIIDALTAGLDDWSAVDGVGRILVGPAWRRGLIDDARVMRWPAANDRWLRRLALVATVALNAQVDGGGGDARRTLRVCRALAGDRDDMVIKALSWALRELIARDRAAVEGFVREVDVAARVRREVAHKLATGLKAPRRVP